MSRAILGTTIAVAAVAALAWSQRHEDIAPLVTTADAPAERFEVSIASDEAGGPASQATAYSSSDNARDDLEEAVPLPIARWHPDNAELAQLQYIVQENGRFVAPVPPPVAIAKKFRFSDGSDITITYKFFVPRTLTPLPRHIGVPLDAYSLADFDALTVLMAEANWEVLNWAEKATAYCASAANNTDHAEMCSGYRQGMRERLHDVYGYLADRGDPDAMKRVALRMLDEGDSDGAHAVFRELWQMGHVAGLSGVIRSTPDVSRLDFDQRVEAFAYNFAAFAISMAYLDGFANESNARENDRMAQRFEDLMVDFGPAARREGERLAKFMLTRNGNCCLTPDPYERTRTAKTGR